MWLNTIRKVKTSDVIMGLCILLPEAHTKQNKINTEHNYSCITTVNFSKCVCIPSCLSELVRDVLKVRVRPYVRLMSFYLLMCVILL